MVNTHACASTIASNLNYLIIDNSSGTPKIGKLIGKGVHGEVFDYNEDVIKLSSLSAKDIPGQSLKEYVDLLLSNLHYIIDFNPIICGKVYDCNIVSETNEQVIYYYVMERLNELSVDEKKVFHSILSHEDNNKIKNYSNDKVKEMLLGMSYGLDFDLEKILLFYNNIQCSLVHHYDLHPRNIMKDNSGNFKLIDFDSVKIKGD